jgi:hypothetical protein
VKSRTASYKSAMIRFTILAILAAAPAQAQEAPTIARQERVPIEQVLGGRIKLSDKEKDDLKEVRRHNKAIEKEFRAMRKGRDDRFALASGRSRQPTRVRTLPANSNSY